MVQRSEFRFIVWLIAVDPEFFADGVVVFAVGSCGAVVAAVENEGVSELGPAGSGEERHEEFLDLRGVHFGFVDEPQAPCESLDVGIDGESDIDPERVSEDDICCFSGDASEGEEFVHR